MKNEKSTLLQDLQQLKTECNAYKETESLRQKQAIAAATAFLDAVTADCQYTNYGEHRSAAFCGFVSRNGKKVSACVCVQKNSFYIYINDQKKPLMNYVCTDNYRLADELKTLAMRVKKEVEQDCLQYIEDYKRLQETKSLFLKHINS